MAYISRIHKELFLGQHEAQKKRRKKVEMNNELLLILALDMREKGEKALKTFSFATFLVF